MTVDGKEHYILMASRNGKRWIATIIDDENELIAKTKSLMTKGYQTKIGTADEMPTMLGRIPDLGDRYRWDPKTKSFVMRDKVALEREAALREAMKPVYYGAKIKPKTTDK